MKFTEVEWGVPGSWKASKPEAASRYGRGYERLVSRLGVLGSVVRLSAMIETTKIDAKYDEPAPAPTVQTNSAVVEFVFPPQPTSLSDDSSYSLGITKGTTVARKVAQQFQFDPSLVTGHLRVEYDSSTTPLLHISDMLGESEIPDEVGQAIIEAFSEY